ncbi:MAG TPA: radical SAM protein [Anaerolineae bacterium]|nr:radical SAM protein [Anaerolineae bacterium]
MSLLAVAAVLEPDYNYTIVDGNLEDDPLATLDQLIRQTDNPLLGLTVMPGPQLTQAVPLCRTLKERHPHLLIVWGGYFPTQHWDVALRAPYVDYVVRGHGEIVFRQLLDHLTNQSISLPLTSTEADDAAPGPNIPGLAYTLPDGSPHSNPLAPIPHPNKLPSWNFDQLPMEHYVRPTFLGSRTLGYHSSYGCPFFCNFCAVVNMVNGRWLPQSAETVAHIAQHYHDQWQVNAIEFYDNNFFVHQARVAEFSERIQHLNLAWWGEGRIDTMIAYDDQTWRLMRDSGLKMVYLGAESGSIETLKRMDKGGQMSPEKTLAIAEKMRRWQIIPEFSFVMGNPPDPEQDIIDTIDFIRKLKTIYPESEIVMYLYTPVPLAGDLYDQAKADGFAFPETLEDWISPAWQQFSQRRSRTMPWIRPTLQDRIHNFERVLNAYYPTSTNYHLKKSHRQALRALSSWRYHLQFYRFPWELRLLHRFVAYQRPETSSF